MDRHAVAQLFNDLVSVGLLVATCQGLDHLNVVKRGFWCSDETIKYPRQPETVTYARLLQISMFAPPTFLALSEILHHQLTKRNRLFFTSQEFWYNLLKVLFSWALCFWANLFLTLFIKLRVGRLRPVFLDYCKPSINCSSPTWQGEYITNFTCNTNHSDEQFARTSFPSGHSSESMVSMVFLVVYLWKRYSYDATRYFVILFQLIILAIGLFVSLSRVYDNIHHWSDVLAGITLGTLVALTISLLPGRLNKFNEDEDSDEVKMSSQVTFRSSA